MGDKPLIPYYFSGYEYRAEVAALFVLLLRNDGYIIVANFKSSGIGVDMPGSWCYG